MKKYTHIVIVVAAVFIAGTVFAFLDTHFGGSEALATNSHKKCVLVIEKTVDKDTANVGDTLTYRIEFSNTGQRDCTGGGVRVVDELDDHLDFVSETHSSNVTAGYGSDPIYKASDHTLRWNANTLTPGESGWVEWTGTVLPESTCGEFKVLNKAKITSREYDNFAIWVESNEVETTIENDCPIYQCPLESADDRTIVLFPENWKLRSDKDSQRSFGPQYFSLPAGVYDVTLVSNDTAHPNGPTQPKEQYYINLADANGDVFFTSSPISDLPDDDTERTEMVDMDVVIAQSAVKISVAHYAPKSTPTANSIRPVCASFDKVSDPESSITLVKVVVNDDGGDAVVSDFDLFLSGDSVVSGVAEVVVPGTYTASEVNLPGYNAGNWTGDCAGDGTVTVAAGEHKTCQIVNNDIPVQIPNLVCTMNASPTSIPLGDSSTLIWTSTSADTATLDHGIGSVGLNDSLSVSPTTTTTYTGTFSNGSDSITCDATIVVVTEPICEAVTFTDAGYERSVAVGQSFSFTIPFKSGTPDVVAATPLPAGLTFDEATRTISGTPTATGTFEISLSASNSCGSEEAKLVVVVTGGGTGCPTCGGGQPDTPKVVLFDKPSDTPISGLSFVYLSQVPYTGIGGVVIQWLFYLLVAFGSIYCAAYLIDPRLRTKLLGIYMRYATANETTMTLDTETYISDEGNVHTLAQRANQQGVLISGEAINYIERNAVGGCEACETLDHVISEARSRYPQEDGWLTLDIDRVQNFI